MGLESHHVLRGTSYYREAAERIASGAGIEVRDVVIRGQEALTDEARLRQLQETGRAGLSRLVLCYELALRDHAPSLYGADKTSPS